MADSTLMISSRNYSSWSLRGWLLTSLSGLEFETRSVSEDDAGARAELLMRTSSILVPCLIHDGLAIWDTIAIAEHLAEALPEAGLLPSDRFARARCRSICGEMHAGFSAMRASLPMNLRARRRGFRIWASAQADIDRIATIWTECLSGWGGPWLFGDRPTMADAFYAPVATRFVTYDVPLAPIPARYRDQVMGWDLLGRWVAAAADETLEIDELDVEF